MKMKVVLVHNSALQGFQGPGKNGLNEINIGTSHAPVAGLITQPSDLQSTALSLCYGCPHKITTNSLNNETK